MTNISDIAREAGLSKVTVSNILNGRNKEVWPSAIERAERVRAIARRMGYTPNAAAKAMSTGRFGSIGYLSSEDPLRSFNAEMQLRGIHERLAMKKLHFTAAMVPDRRLCDAGDLPMLLRELTADGLLIDYIQDVPPAMADAIANSRVPAVWLNTKRDFNCVHPDDVAGSRLATQHLLSRGHTRIALALLTHSKHYSLADRIEGYSDAMVDAGLAPAVFYPDSAPASYRMEIALEYLKSDERPTAIVANGAGAALPFAYAAASLGLSVGTDLAIVTMGGHMDVSLGFEMTTVQLPFAEVGHAAVDAVCRLVDNPDLRLDPIQITPSLLQGRTS
ncbi:MAG: LacI family DNA-binding transcriptional regulator [Planctomycetota bacterium]